MLKENLSLLEDLLKHFNGKKGTILAANLNELITRDLGTAGPSPLTPPPPGAGDEHFQNKYERRVSKDALG